MPFIVGVGRSGTTLLRLMLDAHPDLAIPAETGWVPAAAALPAGPDQAAHLVALVTGHATFPDCGLDPAEYADAVGRLHPFDLAGGVRAFYRLYSAGHGKGRGGDKSPGHSLRPDAISALLPEARIVHIIRDGRDVALSVRPLWFAAGTEIVDLARHWRLTVEGCRDAGRRCRHYTEVRYERLVVDPESELRRVAEVLELSFDPAMLRSHEGARRRLGEVTTWLRPDGSVLISKEERLHNHRLTSTPPDATRIGRWRSEMSAEERAAFAGEAGALLAELGYEV
ncbi:MAG: hypothetical protein QOK40_322 [Miltoncostaeaceae bacterium]|jgi:hypothetical protein|nr:hypothetical protein [Miltoncostaeaceae bacterium]